MSPEDRASGSSGRSGSASSEEERPAEETDVPESTAPKNATFDLEAPPSEDREGSKWASYALATLLVAVFLVGLLRLVDPAATGLLIGALLALFGLAIALLAFRERLR